MNSKVTQILIHDGKYISPVKKALNNDAMAYAMHNKQGFHNGQSRITKLFKGNNTIKTETARSLPPTTNGRKRVVMQTAMHYDNGAVASMTEKRTPGLEIKAGDQFQSFVYKDKDGQVVRKITRDGDSFTAKIPEYDGTTGKIKQFHHYNTNPKNGEIVPDKYMQQAIMQEEATRFSALR
jgi:hypothetical protein